MPRQSTVRSKTGAPFQKGTSMRHPWFWGSLTLLLSGVFIGQPADAGDTAGDLSTYKVLPPIRHGNLTVFPVVAAKSYDTSEFLTLDEGLKNGEVVVTEMGNAGGLVRRQPRSGVYLPPQTGPQVNKLVLINNSKRPLILLAGEIVTGGKQDRVIGKDRLVPAESDPIDLSVFCVEHGRWVGASNKFGAMSFSMAAPSVRGSAMAKQDQQMVWDQVSRAKTAAEASPGVQRNPTAAGGLKSTTSYARVMENEEVKQQIDAVAKPLEDSYASTIKQLRDRHGKVAGWPRHPAQTREVLPPETEPNREPESESSQGPNEHLLTYEVLRTLPDTPLKAKLLRQNDPLLQPKNGDCL